MERTSITPYGTELYLTTDKVNRVDEEKAIVQQVQNLLFIKPGTYPNDPELGIGIEDEQFEMADDNYLNDLKNRIDMQIDKFIVTDYLIETRISLKQVAPINYQKVLVVEVFVGKTSENLVKADLLFTRVPETNKLKFNVII